MTYCFISFVAFAADFAKAGPVREISLPASPLQHLHCATAGSTPSKWIVLYGGSSV